MVLGASFIGAEHVQGFSAELFDNRLRFVGIFCLVNIGKEWPRPCPALLIGGKPPAHVKAVFKSDGVFQHGHPSAICIAVIKHGMLQGVHPLGEMQFVACAVMADNAAVNTERVDVTSQVHSPLEGGGDVF